MLIVPINEDLSMYKLQLNLNLMPLSFATSEKLDLYRGRKEPFTRDKSVTSGITASYIIIMAEVAGRRRGGGCKRNQTTKTTSTKKAGDGDEILLVRRRIGG